MAAKDLGASGVLYTDRRIFYLSPQTTRELWPSVSPFTTVAANFSMVQTPDPDFKLFEHRSGFIDAGFDIAATPSAWPSSGAVKQSLSSVTVTNIKGLASTPDSSWLGKVVEFWDATYTTYKGVARIQASSTTLTFRTMGNPARTDNAMVDLVAGDHARVMSHAWGEGQTAPEASSDELEVVYGSCQILRTTVDITGTLYQAALRGYSNELARLRIEKEKEHKFAKELMGLHGVRIGGTGSRLLSTGAVSGSDSFVTHDTDADGKYVRTSMGMIPLIWRYGTSDPASDNQNIFSIDPATYTYDQFVLDSEKCSQYLPDMGYKYGFCGRGMISYFSMVGEGNSMIGNSGMKVEISDFKEDALGFTFRELNTPHLTIRLVPTPGMRGPYRNAMLVVDPGDIHHVTYRQSAYYTNIKTDNRYDGVKDEFFSDEGFGTTLIEKHSYWTLTNTPVARRG